MVALQAANYRMPLCLECLLVLHLLVDVVRLLIFARPVDMYFVQKVLRLMVVLWTADHELSLGLLILLLHVDPAKALHIEGQLDFVSQA
jgi:hypothetical protein